MSLLEGRYMGAGTISGNLNRERRREKDVLCEKMGDVSLCKSGGFYC
jgi:hypothetical protein